jgi:beta-lactamase superfamily II metal-dependent hydrolase
MLENVNLGNRSQLLILPAFHGDCLILKTFDAIGSPFTMLIDGGTSATFESSLKNVLREITKIDVVVLTHIDSDHIGGLIKFVKHAYFKPEKVGRYWFNSRNLKFIDTGDQISYGQAKSFEELLIEKGEIKEKLTNDLYAGEMPELPEGIFIEILSPTPEILNKLNHGWLELSDEYKAKIEDIPIAEFKPSQLDRGSLEELALADDQPEKTIMGDLFNSSSLAFILKTFDISIFFMGDSHPNVIKEQMNLAGYSSIHKLQVDFVKVSHHGSKNNTINDVLDMIDCERFIISTNGGSSTHTHPDRETIARIIHHPERVKNEYVNQRKIYLNYPRNVVERKAGVFVEDLDFETGHWLLIDNQTEFEHE